MALPVDFLKYEIQQIGYIQENFKGLEGVLSCLSDYMGPTRAQFVTGPILTALTGGNLAETMFATSLVDYMSASLKWVLQEHRPFWYVYEPGVYLPGEHPKLRHTPLTCETTSGGPSGHSAMITVILHLQRKWIVDYLGKQFKGNRSIFNVAVSSGMVSLIILMWASRMYFASHFLHQCVSGTGLAMSVVLCAEQNFIRKKMLRAKRKKAIGFALGMLAATGLLYGGLNALGVDPMWSVNKALKACHSTQHVGWETTPLYNVARNLGCTLGVALCAPLQKKLKEPKDWAMTLKATVAFVVLDSAILANAPKDLGGCMFLAYVFGASVFHSYAMIDLVPACAKLFGEADPEEKEEKKEDEGEKKKGGENREEGKEKPAEEVSSAEEAAAKEPTAEESAAEEPPVEEPQAEEG